MEQDQKVATPDQIHFLAVIREFGREALETVVVRAQSAETPGHAELAGSGHVQLAASATGVEFRVGDEGPFWVTHLEAEQLMGLGDSPAR